MKHHGESLRRLVNDDDLLEQLKMDFREADLKAEDMAMLRYVARLTETPSTMGEEDVDALREAGFNDRGILDIAQITAYFAFVTRMAHGLGVRLEDW